MAFPEQIREMTFDEFEKFTLLPENRDRNFELIDGEAVEKMGASFVPSEIAATVVYHLVAYKLRNPIGRVTGADGTYKMDDHNAFIPDVGFILHSTMPATPERYAPVPPDLAVEVMSPTDSKRQLRRKADRYIELGSKIVWLIFPDEQRVEVYVADQDVLELGLDGILSGGDLLPGFELNVRDIFPK